MPNTEHLEKQLYDLDEQMTRPLPTPVVGTNVQWFARGAVSPETAQAALVVGVEGPGRLKLTVFPPNGMPVHKQGVLHVSHSQHETRGNAATVHNGAWDYLPNWKLNKSSPDYNLHLDHLNRRKETVKREIDAVVNSAAGKKDLADKALAESK
jgi:hypothetical protein